MSVRVCRTCREAVERRSVVPSYSNPDGFAWACGKCDAWWPTSGTLRLRTEPKPETGQLAFALEPEK